MKPVKYTMVALALIAAASFTTSAKAANAGDVILGVYDAASSGAVPTSYEVDLGAFSTLTANESFNLGTTIASTFSSDSSASLVFDIATSSSTLQASEGLSASKEIAFTAPSAPSPASSNSNANTAITFVINDFNALGTAVTLPSTTSSTGTSISAVTVANGTGSFATEFNTNGGDFGLGGSAGLGDTYPTSNVETFYTKLNSTTSVVADGTFSFSTNGSGQEILTFDATAVPEPSTYALVLCALALFGVLKRRNSVA